VPHIFILRISRLMLLSRLSIKLTQGMTDEQQLRGRHSVAKFDPVALLRKRLRAAAFNNSGGDWHKLFLSSDKNAGGDLDRLEFHRVLREVVGWLFVACSAGLACFVGLAWSGLPCSGLVWSGLLGSGQGGGGREGWLR
jgi:hypothetical protein